MLTVPQEADDGIYQDDPDWPSAGNITFKNVSLRYRPTTEVILNGLSFVAKAGEKIGVVGRTGAGKSTICLSLSRIVEIFEGTIIIDGIDIRTTDLAYLRSRITVIP
jgi:ABC-type multidrug transport system fused ATPase/permease subunit